MWALEKTGLHLQGNVSGRVASNQVRASTLWRVKEESYSSTCGQSRTLLYDGGRASLP